MFAVCTDGCKAMAEINTGLVLRILRQNKIDVLKLHCKIQQEALYAKPINLNGIMVTVVKITNLIIGGHSSLTYRRFLAFLE